MPCKLLAYNSLKSHFLRNELHIKAFFFQCRDAAGRAVVPGAPELLEPEQPVSSLLSNTFLGACFISPMRCSAVPHFNLFVFCFGIFFRLDLSLSLINFCCLYGVLLLFFFFFPLLFWHSAWHCGSKLLKVPCSKKLRKKISARSYVKLSCEIFKPLWENKA